MWVVVESTGKDRVNYVCTNEGSATDLFCKLVQEYGVEPWEELINEGVYEAEDYCVYFSRAIEVD